MSSQRKTVAACVFQGHAAAGHDCHECPLVKVLARRIRDLELEDSPAHLEREVDKYRSLARVLSCPALAEVIADQFVDSRVRGPHRRTTHTATIATRQPAMRGS